MAELATGIQVDKARRGEFLFRQGDQDNLHIYLLGGTVVLLAGGREIETISGRSNTARFPLSHEKPRQHTCQAQGLVSYLRIDSTRLNNMVAQSLAVGRDRHPPADPGDWVAYVLQSSLFQQLPSANVEMILQRMEEISVRRGEIIIRQGEAGDYYFVVIQGQINVFQRQGTRDIEIAQLGPGASFGEDALISGYPRNSTVTALSDGSLVRLRKEDFVALIQKPLSSALSYLEAGRQVTEGAVWMDVRPPQAFERRHLAGAVSVPFEALRFIIPSLSRHKTYVVYGDQPHCIVTAAFVLKEYGFSAMILDNGLEGIPENAWRLSQPDEISAESQTGDDSQLSTLNSNCKPCKANVPQRFAVSCRPLKKAAPRFRSWKRPWLPRKPPGWPWSGKNAI
ncbi:MAG: cyclic nucleotide-binding domain-containing protein [Pseudomonadota bacterium]